MTTPNNPYNRALSDLNDYVVSQLEKHHADLDKCVENDGCDKQLYRLIGRIAALSGVSLELNRLEQPDEPEQSDPDPVVRVVMVEHYHYDGSGRTTFHDSVDDALFEFQNAYAGCTCIAEGRDDCECDADMFVPDYAIIYGCADGSRLAEIRTRGECDSRTFDSTRNDCDD